MPARFFPRHRPRSPRLTMLHERAVAREATPPAPPLPRGRAVDAPRRAPVFDVVTRRRGD